MVKKREGWEEIESELPEIWNPSEEGEELEGYVTEKDEGLYGVYVVIKTADTDELIQTPAHKILQRKLEEIEEGDYVKIRYEGRIRTSRGRRAESYRVYRKKEVR